jgi:hypothetical protein
MLSQIERIKRIYTDFLLLRELKICNNIKKTVQSSSSKIGDHR